MSTADYIRDLQNVIEKVLEVKSSHVESVAVKEIFEGKIIWDGVVEVFRLFEHPISDRLYAWSHEFDETGERRYVTVFHAKLITTPQLAVRAVIIGERMNREQKRSKSR